MASQRVLREKKTCRFHLGVPEEREMLERADPEEGYLRIAVPDSSSEPAMRRTDPVRVISEIAMFGESTARST